MTLSRFNPFKLCFPAPFTSSKILGRLRHCPWTQVPEILRANELPKDLKPNKMCLTLCHWCGPSRVCTRGRMIVNHILFPHLRERFRALLTLCIDLVFKKWGLCPKKKKKGRVSEHLSFEKQAPYCSSDGEDRMQSQEKDSNRTGETSTLKGETQPPFQQRWETVSDVQGSRSKL